MPNRQGLLSEKEATAIAETLEEKGVQQCPACTDPPEPILIRNLVWLTTNPLNQDFRWSWLPVPSVATHASLMAPPLAFRLLRSGGRMQTKVSLQDGTPEAEEVNTSNAAEKRRKIRVQFTGEKEIGGDFLLEPEQENIALRARITRYSELVATSVAGFAFCAFIDALREPRNYHGWIIVAILLAVILAGIIVRRQVAPSEAALSPSEK